MAKRTCESKRKPRAQAKPRVSLRSRRYRQAIYATGCVAYCTFCDISLPNGGALGVTDPAYNNGAIGLLDGAILVRWWQDCHNGHRFRRDLKLWPMTMASGLDSDPLHVLR